MSRPARFVASVFGILLFAARLCALPSFPGAEGFGTDTPGGRGGRVIAVTNLDDSGPGSLRAALMTKGPRIVVFRVGGTIRLQRNLVINEPYITVAGQSAPGDGICLRGAGLRIETHDVVIRHLRVRVGDDPGGPNPENRDAIGIAHDRAEPHHIVLDHCSVSWAIDENLQLWYRCHDITIQWCLVTESLEKSLHPKGAHGMGLLVGDHARRVSVHHNLFAHNMDRSPLLKGDTEAEVLNNVVYNWRSAGTSFGDPEGSGPGLADIRGNLYLPGAQSGTGRPGISIRDTVKPGTRIFLADNEGPGRVAGDEWTAAANRAKQDVRASARVLPGERIKVQPVADASRVVLERAGASQPHRDAVDRRVVRSVQERTGTIINSPADVGGWPDYETGESPADSDADGIPDRWEAARGLDPRDGHDGAGLAPSGYTWVEEYLNELAH